MILFERVPELRPLGDMISFGQNAGRIFNKWPGVMEGISATKHKADTTVYHNWEGKYVTTQKYEEERFWGPTPRLDCQRGELQLVVYEYAKDAGIDIRLGQEVTDYFESDTEAGIVANGERYVADVVVAAEGVKSPARKIVLGVDDKPKPSGYAIYRTWFSSDGLKQNPVIQQTGVLNAETTYAYIGHDIHFLCGSIKDTTGFAWVCTHKDEAEIEESWQFPGKIEDALKVLNGWAPEVLEIVKATPEDRLVDFKLVFRDPLPTFISPKRRVALIGDGAHPFLPTSVQGASQAMEDGVTMAACLHIAGKAHVAEALEVYEKIRYERVHKVQATGITTRNDWHKADWDKIWKEPKLLHLKREEWILNFDSEEHAYSQYETIRASLGVGGEKSSGVERN